MTTRKRLIYPNLTELFADEHNWVFGYKDYPGELHLHPKYYVFDTTSGGILSTIYVIDPNTGECGQRLTRMIRHPADFTALLAMIEAGDIQSISLTKYVADLPLDRTRRIFGSIYDLAEQAEELDACEEGIDRALEAPAMDCLIETLEADDLRWMANHGFVQVFDYARRNCMQAFTPREFVHLCMRYPEMYDSNLVQFLTTALDNRPAKQIVFMLLCFTEFLVPKELVKDLLSDPIIDFICKVRPWRELSFSFD